MHETIASFLAHQGFNKKDREIYLDIYTHGISYASSIATRTKIDRTTVYSVLKRLLQKGIIAQTEVNEVNAYMSVSPEIFVDIIERDIADLKGRKKMAQDFIEEVLKLEKQFFEKPTVRIFEGNEAVMNLYLSTLQKSDIQKSFLTVDIMPKGLKKFLKRDFIAKKIQKNTFSKVLVEKSKLSTRYQSLDMISNRETRIIKKFPFKLHSEIILCKSKEVAIIDFHKHVHGLIIESETFYKTMESLFDVIWSVSS